MKSKILLCLALFLSGHCRAAIVYPKAPDGGRQMVYKLMSGTLQENLHFFGGLRAKDLTIAGPYQSYSVGPSNLAAGKLLSDVELGSGGGWQYFITHGTNCVGLAYVKTDEKSGKALKCTELGHSGFGRLEALRVAEQLSRVKKQDYELRSLDMPWFLFHAFWLHGKSDDIFIPLSDNRGRWKAYQPYSESEMIEILKPEAKVELKEPQGMPD